MDKKLFDSCLNFIEEMIWEDNKIVTYKSLSASLGIHVNTAKQLLYTFLMQHKNKDSSTLTATYLLVGKLKDSRTIITIVDENNKAKEEAKFLTVTSDHVYSVQSARLKSINALYGIANEKNMHKKLNVIEYKKCTTKSNKASIITDNETLKGSDKLLLNKDITKVNSEEPEINKLENPCIKENKVLNESPPKKKSSGSKIKGEKNQKILKNIKTTNNIATLFANAAQKSKKVVAQDAIPLKTNNFVQDEMNEKSQMMEFSTNEVKNYSKKKGKEGVKRKRIRLLSDSDDDSVRSMNSNESDEVSHEEDSKPTQTVEINDVDDFYDDDHEEKEIEHKNKRKKRKIVDVTLMNKDGYLETRKEIVLATDSEEEVELIPPCEKTNQTSSLNSKINETQIECKKEINARGPRKQSSLLSFFKKN